MHSSMIRRPRETRSPSCEGLDAGPGGPPLLVLVAGALGVVVEATHATHQVHPASHLLLGVRRQVVDPPRGADIEHVLEPHLAALKGEAGVNLES